MAIPPYKELTTYVLKALRELGGSAPVPAVEQKVADLLGLSIAERSEPHKRKKTKLSYRVAWARFYLKKRGLLESSKRGISVLSEKGRKEAGL